VIGAYRLSAQIAQGGMATVHLGQLQGPAGFSRVVAIKRLRRDFASDAQLVTMLLDEARTSARVRHPNVVPTLDVVVASGEVLLVMDYVHGESLMRLLAAQRERASPMPVAIALAIVVGALRGLHAAHEAKDQTGAPLELVHRDLSPHNILVDTSGTARVSDFGVAKARGRHQVSTVGELKGKASYMAPEQVHGDVSPRSDVFSMGVVLWEALTGDRLFDGKSDGEILAAVMLTKVPPARSKNPAVSEALDGVVRRSLSRRKEDRYATALELADAIEACAPRAGAAEVARWVEGLVGETLAAREQQLVALECVTSHERVEVGALLTRLPRRVRRAAPLALTGVVVLAAVLGLARVARVGTPPPTATSGADLAPSGVRNDPAEDPASLEPHEDELGPPTAPPRRHMRRAPKRDCDPPYVTSTNGRKIYKRQCF
jgi:serine/threonine-protein kinase